MGTLLLIPESFQDIPGRHREFAHPNAHGVVDGVGDGGHGRYDAYLAHSSHPVGMGGVGHFHDHRVDHGQVQTSGHAVIQEAGIGHLALIVEEVLLIQRPADPLDRSSLHLAFHVAGVDGLSSVLQRGVSEDFHFAGLGVYLHVYDVYREAGTSASGVYVGVADNGAPGAVQAAGKLLKGEFQLGVRLVSSHSTRVVNVVNGTCPDRGGPLALGAGNAGGIGIFLDKQGNDSYIIENNERSCLGYVTPAKPTSIRKVIQGIGLFLDLGGVDGYTVSRASNNAAWTSITEPAGTVLPGVARGIDREIPSPEEK